MERAGIGKNRFLLKLQKLSPLQWASTGGVRRDEGGDSISGHVLCVRPSVATLSTLSKLPMTLNAAGTCPKSHSQQVAEPRSKPAETTKLQTSTCPCCRSLSWCGGPFNLLLEEQGSAR